MSLITSHSVSALSNVCSVTGSYTTFTLSSAYCITAVNIDRHTFVSTPPWHQSLLHPPIGVYSLLHPPQVSRRHERLNGHVRQVTRCTRNCMMNARHVTSIFAIHASHDTACSNIHRATLAPTMMFTIGTRRLSCGTVTILLFMFVTNNLPPFIFDCDCISCPTLYTHVAHDSCTIYIYETELLFVCFIVCTFYVMLIPRLISHLCIHAVNACHVFLLCLRCL